MLLGAIALGAGVSAAVFKMATEAVKLAVTVTQPQKAATNKKKK